MSDSKVYDADYFLRGRETGKSLYEDYRWMPELTIPMCRTIVNHCGIAKCDHILDFGCARGYVVKAMRGLGYDAYGVDISEWAIRNADEETKPYLNWCENSPPLLDKEFDWVIAKDVLEHIKYVQQAIAYLMRVAAKGVFAVVPLSKYNFGDYVVEEYEIDVTHAQRWPLNTWVGMFLQVGWSVEVSYRVPGVKDNYYRPGWELGNGFITARRIN